MDVKLKVTQEGFDEHFSIDDWFNFNDLSHVEIYEKMLNFVVDDEGNPIDIEQAKKLFKKIKKKEWPEYVTAFMKAITEAFVNPTSGNG
jgi:hypothetical protein